MSPICILIFLAMALGADSQGALFVPCSEPAAPDPDHPLPEFPDQYQTHVEANIVQKNYTVNIMEYYDYTNNKFSSSWYSHRDGSKVKMVGRPEEEEIRLIFTNGSCHVKHINATGSRFFSFVSGANGTHVRSIKDLMAFGKEYGETYIGGDERVRGIPVDHWQSCLKYSHAEGNFTLDFYFTKDTNYTVDTQAVRIPVRAVLNGTGVNFRNMSAGIHQFYHIYDFTNFHAGPIADQTIFEIPPGVFCTGSNITKALPDVPAHFSAGIEQIIEQGENHMEFPAYLYMDEEAKVMRLDAPRPLSPSELRRFGSSPLTYISDSNAGLMYIIDKWEENCTVVQATDMFQDFPPDQFLALFKGDFVYQGQKMFRGLDVESWAYINETSKDFTELFFHSGHALPGPANRPTRPVRQAPGITVGPPKTSPISIVGVYLSTTQPLQHERTIHYYGYTPGHPAAELFDVSRCYILGHHYVYMAFKVQADYDQDVYFRRREFVVSIRNAIARGAGVSVTRVTALFAEKNAYDDKQVIVYFKLLDNQVYGLSGDQSGPTLAQAKLSLSSAIAGGLNFDVQYPTIEQNFEVVKNTLWEVMSSTASKADYSSTLQRYGPGAMAGLAIGMLVLGVLLGLLGAFIIYKRIDTSVPYRETQ